MRVAIQWVSVFVLIVNINSLNYILAYFSGRSGQDISALTLVISLLVLLHQVLYRTNHPPTSIRRFVMVTMLMIMVVPLISYLIHYEGQNFDALFFWMKRVLFVVTTFLVGLSLLHQFTIQQWERLARFMFLISVGTVLYSYWFPEQSRLYFTAGDMAWDYFGDSDIRAVGTTMNPNGASFAIVVSYAVLYAIGSFRKYAHKYRATIIVDTLFFFTLLLTGSRSGVLVGIAIFAIWKIDISLPKEAEFKIKTKRIWLPIASFGIVVVAIWWLLQTASFLDFSRVDRIFEIDQGDNIESNAVRYQALLEALVLLAQNPLGLGFEIRNNMLFTQAHNMFASYALDNGIFLGLAYPVFLYATWSLMRIRRLRLMRISYMTLLIGFSLFDHGIIESKPFAWVVVAIAFALHQQWEILRTPMRLEQDSEDGRASYSHSSIVAAGTIRQKR